MSDLGNKEIMAKNIQYYMDKFGLGRQDMCNAIGVKYTTFTDWVKGNSYPRIDKIELMANYFGIEKSDLVERRVSRQKMKGVRVPVIGTVPAGIPIEACEDILDWEEIPEDMARMGEHFGLKIKGHSMEPKIGDGDIVIVRIQSDVDSGSIVIARIGSDEEVTCKKLLKNKDGVTFVPFNPSYEALYYTNEQIHTLPVTIMGKVVELRSKFE